MPCLNRTHRNRNRNGHSKIKGKRKSRRKRQRKRKPKRDLKRMETARAKDRGRDLYRRHEGSNLDINIQYGLDGGTWSTTYCTDML